MNWRFALLLIGTGAVGWAAEGDATALLAQVRARVHDNARRIPRYICRQQIDRQVYAEPWTANLSCGKLAETGLPTAEKKLALQSTDRVRLDVILGEGSELFSWPGARSFETSDPGTLAPGGFSGSGDFAGYVMDIFSLEQVVFDYQGSCGGGACARFGYKVPLEASHYTLKTRFQVVTVGYHGTFDVDSGSANLLRMTVIPTVPFSVLQVCEMRTRMTYTRTTDAREFTIPASTEKEFLSTDGAYYVNRSSYEGCRQYSSESTLTFEEEGPGASPKAAAPAALPVRGSELQLRLVTRIESERNAAGDVVEATLEHPVGDSRGGTIAAGTVFRGHVTRLEKIYVPRSRVVVAIKFDTIVLDGARVAMNLIPAGTTDARGELVHTFDEGKVTLDKKFVSRWSVR